MSINIKVQIDEKIIPIQTDKGQNLLQVLRKNNINISSPCGGNKTCGKCKVKLIDGEAPVTDSEINLLSEKELNNGYRLACSINVENDITIELVEEGQLQVMTDSMAFAIDFDPAVQVFDWCSEKIKDENDISHLELLYDFTSTEEIELSALKQLASLTENKKVSVLSYYNRINAVKNETVDKLYGLAVDIGTTTVAVYLMNLLTGKEVDVESFHNPQKKFGADVISRINYTQEDNNLVEEVQEVIINGLNNAIDKLCSRNNIEANDIYLSTIVGNTIMQHFFLGVNPHSIARAPYRPVFTDIREVYAEKINLSINPQGIVQVLPSVSGYVGSDIVADLLIADFDSEEWNLLIDIGTNGEIVLGNSQRMLACSAAAGPAFEGAKISFGVAGVPGAISQFSILDGEFNFKTIGSETPIGICGSGLIDIIAEMLENNIITSMGAFNNQLEGDLSNYITNYNDIKALTIVNNENTAIDSDILLTQKDIREFQLAKGAIAAGISILLKEAGIDYKDINNIYLAGGFGSFIDPENACRIGLLPQNMEEKIVKVGNGAGLGARAYLLDKKQRRKAEKIIDKIDYLELSLRKDFQDEFMMSMEF